MQWRNRPKSRAPYHQAEENYGIEKSYVPSRRTICTREKNKQVNANDVKIGDARNQLRTRLHIPRPRVCYTERKHTARI